MRRVKEEALGVWRRVWRQQHANGLERALSRDHGVVRRRRMCSGVGPPRTCTCHAASSRTPLHSAL